MAGRRLVLVALLLVAAAFQATGASRGHKYTRFDLLRREPASLAELWRTDRQRTTLIAARARARARRVHARRTAETSTSSSSSPPEEHDNDNDEAAFAMPLSSGAYTGTGQYFVRFRVGTPAQPFLLVADTGSDLTWVKCTRPTAAEADPYGLWNNDTSLSPSPSPAPAPSRRAFRPDDSRTWRPIPCSSDTCVQSLPFSLAVCPTPGSPCAYDYRYKDGSAARGTVGTDSATIALSGPASSSSSAATNTKASSNKAKLRGVVLGCTTSYNGDSFLASDGVLSLGYSNISFASRAASRFGGRFSYCLVDHLAPRNRTSYLTFGPNPAVSPPPASSSTPAVVDVVPKPACEYSSPPPRRGNNNTRTTTVVPGSRTTPLLLDHRTRPFYAVTVTGVSVDGELLEIPRLVWDVERGGGTILDSGTSLTVLATPAYRAVVAALSGKLAGVPRVTMDPFDYCYNWTSPSTGADLNVPVPKLAVHFAGSARMEPPSKSYVIDAAPGVKCIGLQEGEWPGVSVIGNILQQEHLWEFDLKNRRLRFQRSRCTH